MVRRAIDTNQSFQNLEKWVENENIKLGETIPDDISSLQLLHLLWTNRDIKIKKLKNIPSTNLLVHRVNPKQNLKFYKTKNVKYFTNKKWWLKTIIEKNIETGIYERIVIANGRSFNWNEMPIFVEKSGQQKPRLIFNYHFVYEEFPGSHIILAIVVHDLLFIFFNTTFFSANSKYGYWVILVHPKGRHYFAFNIPDLKQWQSTKFQVTKIS